MKRVLFIVFGFLGLSIGQASGQETRYDVEYARICLIDSIAPDTMVQFWRFSQANNPGGNVVDVTYDLSGAYTPAGTLLPCCSCLTAASDTYAIAPAMPGPPSPGLGWWWVPIGLVLAACFWIMFLWLMLTCRPKRLRIAYFLPLALLFSYSSLSAQSETRYDIEYTCICLVDSIGPGNVVQFYRFTQANNPGGNVVDVTYDLSGAYTPTGTVLSCNDYYLGDNVNTGGGTAGTLAIWTGTYSLGNSSVTESGGNVVGTSFTGAFGLAVGTTAQNPVGANGRIRYNTTEDGISAWNGAAAAWQYLPWADADNWASGRIPFSNGTNLTSSANLYFSEGDSDGLIIGNSTGNANGLNVRRMHTSGDIAQFQNSTPTTVFVIDGSGNADFKQNLSGVGLKWGSSGMTMISQNTGLDLTLPTSGGNKGFVINAGGSDVICLGGNNIGSNLTSQVGIGAYEIFAPDPGGTGLTIRGADGGGNDNLTSNLTIRGGRPFDAQNNGGDIYIINGKSGSNISGGSQGNPGIVRFQCVPDSVGAGGATYRLVEWGGAPENPGIRLYNLDQTTSGIRTLTMESDTIKHRIENLGTISTSTDGSGDIVVAHGMGTTPTSVQVTVTGTTPYIVTVHSIDATNFTVRFFDTSGAAVVSTAVTATWHCKT